MPLDGSNSSIHGYLPPGRYLSSSGGVLFGAGAGFIDNADCGPGAMNTSWVADTPEDEAHVLHYTESQIGRIVSDEQYVYWPEHCDGSIRRVAREGGTPPHLATFDFASDVYLAPIAIVGPYLYYSDVDGAVYRVAR